MKKRLFVYANVPEKQQNENKQKKNRKKL